jgi:hypothetical protein
MENLEVLVRQALESFEYDPPDTDFQRGYLAAIQWVEEMIEKAEPERPILN